MSGLRPVYNWDMMGKTCFGRFIDDAVRNVMAMHNSASPARIEEVCSILKFIGGALDELSTQLEEERKEREAWVKPVEVEEAPRGFFGGRSK